MILTICILVFGAALLAGGILLLILRDKFSNPDSVKAHATMMLFFCPVLLVAGILTLCGVNMSGIKDINMYIICVLNLGCSFLCYLLGLFVLSLVVIVLIGFLSELAF
jgi:hypothetical protein